MRIEPGDADPGSDPEGSEEPVVHRSGDRPTAGKDQHRGEDDADADRADPGQLTAQVAMEQRRRGDARGARARGAPQDAVTGVRLRVGRVGAERAMS